MALEYPHPSSLIPLGRLHYSYRKRFFAMQSDSAANGLGIGCTRGGISVPKADAIGLMRNHAQRNVPDVPGQKVVCRPAAGMFRDLVC